MDIGDIFVSKDSRGFYLSKVTRDRIDMSPFSKHYNTGKRTMWVIEVIYAWGPQVQDGKGTHAEGNQYYVNKERSNIWIWI